MLEPIPALSLIDIAEFPSALPRLAAVPRPSRTASATPRYWNIARQRHYRFSARSCWTLRVSADRTAWPRPHTGAKPGLFQGMKAKSGERRTVCWREVDSNHRSPPEIVRPSERFVQRSLGRSTDVFRRDREFDVSAVQGRLSTSSPGQCSTEPGLIAETWLWTTFPDAGPVVRIHFPPAESQQTFGSS